MIADIPFMFSFHFSQNWLYRQKKFDWSIKISNKK